jgi:hypothetical protein
MKITIPVEPTDWKRRYAEAITTTYFPVFEIKKDHKGGGEIHGWNLVKMMARLAEKEAKVGA